MAGSGEIIRKCTCTAPVNIAVIKYWGKRDEELILPVNSSLSVTLNQAEMCATTTAAIGKKFAKDRLWLNGVEKDIDFDLRLQRCLKELRRLYCKQRSKARNSATEEEEDISRYHIHICSQNNFPTAAGLASSAAGYACLVATLGRLFGIDGDLSSIARQGSGSACRSMYGGFVKWEKGVRDDGLDSVAIQISPESHWPDMHALILVVSDHQKKVSSTAGMRKTVETSELLKYRAEVIVPKRMNEIEEAILKKDFTAFAEITMKDSNQFHAVCLDTFPPISYLTDTSHLIIQAITQYNKIKGTPKAAYTFDAGPNAVIYTLAEDVNEVLSLVCHVFPPRERNQSYVKGIMTSESNVLPSKDIVDAFPSCSSPKSLQYIVHTKVGPGPLSSDVALLDYSGFPCD